MLMWCHILLMDGRKLRLPSPNFDHISLLVITQLWQRQHYLCIFHSETLLWPCLSHSFMYHFSSITLYMIARLSFCSHFSVSTTSWKNKSTINYFMVNAYLRRQIYFIIIVYAKYFFGIVVFLSSYLSLSAEYICSQALNVQWISSQKKSGWKKSENGLYLIEQICWSKCTCQEIIPCGYN